MRRAALILAAFAILSPLLIQGPPILGIWESSTFVTTYGSKETVLSLGTSPRANIGGTYALLELIRPVGDLLDLSLNLRLVRLPAAISGSIFLLLLFIIGRRIFGTVPASIGLLLIASNPVFIHFSHDAIILMPSLAAFALFIERLQAFIENSQWWQTCTLSVATTLALSLYGPGRLYTLIVLGGALAALLWMALQGSDPAWAFTRIRLVISSILGTSILLVLGNAGNVNVLGLSLILPKNSESIVAAASEGGVLETLRLNTQITLESIFGVGSSFHSRFLEVLSIQGRYPILLPIASFVLVLGLVVTIRQVLQSSTTRKRIERISVLLLFFLTLTAPLASTTESIASPTGGDLLISTLSTYRLSYCLIPISFLSMSAAAWVLDFAYGQRQTLMRLAIALALVIAVVFVQTHTIVSSQSTYASALHQSLKADYSAEQALKWLPPGTQEYVAYPARHAQFHQYLRKIAEDTAQAINAPISTSTNSNVFALDVPLECIQRELLAPTIDASQENISPVILSLYLAQHLPTIQVLVPTFQKQDGAPGVIAEKVGNFPGRLDFDRSPLDYFAEYSPQGFLGEEHNGSGSSSLFVATTPKERDYISSYVTSRGDTLVWIRTQSCLP